MQRPCAPKARRPTFGPLCIRPTILPFLCSCPFLVSIFTVGLCVLWVLCGPSKATARCYTSICDGIIPLIRKKIYFREIWQVLLLMFMTFADAGCTHQRLSTWIIWEHCDIGLIFTNLNLCSHFQIWICVHIPKFESATRICINIELCRPLLTWTSQLQAPATLTGLVSFL